MKKKKKATKKKQKNRIKIIIKILSRDVKAAWRQVPKKSILF